MNESTMTISCAVARDLMGVEGGARYPDATGPVYISVKVCQTEVEVKIKDCGRGIEDVDKAREPMFTTGGTERSGMGFTVMESFCDSVRVKSKPGAGTTVVLCKKFRSRR